jgi:hypothetical protein
MLFEGITASMSRFIMEELEYNLGYPRPFDSWRNSPNWTGKFPILTHTQIHVIQNRIALHGYLCLSATGDICTL